MKVSHKQKLDEHFPNQAVEVSTEERRMSENNYFLNTEVIRIREKYTKCTVLLDYLNQELELERTTTVEEFAVRLSNLFEAANVTADQ